MFHSSNTVTKLISRREAAYYLGIKPATLAAWALTQRHALPMIKIGRRVLYRMADLDAFIDANAYGAVSQ